MTRQLHISKDLSLPLDWMTLATVVYGARGSGKTTLGSVIAEECAKAGQRFCAIDLKGDWYGLKGTADDKAAGIPVVIFGGDHHDLPLEEGAGAFVGETVAALSQSCILDLEYFSKGKQLKFLAPFFETLYDRNRDPLLLLLDEAQRKIESAKPQTVTETKTKTEIKKVEKRVVISSDISRLEKVSESFDGIVERLRESFDRVEIERSKIAVLLTEAREINEAANKEIAPQPTPVSSIRARQTEGYKPTAIHRQVKADRALAQTNGDFRASSSQQRILNSLAWAESIGLSEMAKTQLALMADQSPTSGGYFNNLGALRTAGLLHYPSAGNVALTDTGRGYADPESAPTTNEELHKQIYAKLSGSQTNILRELISAYPSAIKKDDLAERVGQSSTSGGYFNNLGRLRTLKLIDYPQAGYAAATPILFIEG